MPKNRFMSRRHLKPGVEEAIKTVNDKHIAKVKGLYNI